MKELIDYVLNVVFVIICLFLLVSLILYFLRKHRKKISDSYLIQEINEPIREIEQDNLIQEINEPIREIEQNNLIQEINEPIREIEQDNLIQEGETLLREFQGRQFKIQQFKIVKSGNSEAEYEDRAKISEHNNKFLRIAIADGASESLYSDIWAELIVEKFIEKGYLETSELQEIYQSFIETTNKRIENAPEMRRWTMYKKIERGTCATMAGIEFLSSDYFRLTVIGDSCIFYQGEKDSKIEMLPEMLPDDFGNCPQSICHIPQTWENLTSQWIKKDVFKKDALKIVLCTDALAQFLTKDLTIWETLFKLNDQESFTNLINDLRAQQVLKNDDVTLVTIDVLPLNV